jgi:hypothetical protein
MNIEVRIERHFRNGRRIYPVCANAKRFAEIAGTVTITDAAKKLIQELGVNIIVIPETLDVLA